MNVAARNRFVCRVEPSDEGEYLCQAKNPAGSIETSARLRVHAAPSFVKTPSDVSIESGGTAMFECEAEGQPLPASFWSREGQQVRPSCLKLMTRQFLFSLLSLMWKKEHLLCPDISSLGLLFPV